jgi:hypothetical protein
MGILNERFNSLLSILNVFGLAPSPANLESASAFCVDAKLRFATENK